MVLSLVNLDLVVGERQSLHTLPLYPWWKLFGLLLQVYRGQWRLVWTLPSWICQKWTLYFSLAFTCNWLFWFYIRGKVLRVPHRDTDPIMGVWRQANCSTWLVFTKGILSSPSDPLRCGLSLEEDCRVREIGSLSPSLVCSNTFACNNIHHRRSVQGNPWKHLGEVQHWLHTSWLDFPHLECHLCLAACLASLRLVRDLSKVFSLLMV